MKSLDPLYQDIIMEHYRSPRNKADLSHVSDNQTYENPSCGDTVKLEVLFDDDGRIVSAQFDGYGCAISTASASLMSESILGKTGEEARTLMERVIKVMGGEAAPKELEAWGEVAALGGVAPFPSRVKCAELPWQALKNLLDKEDGTLG